MNEFLKRNSQAKIDSIWDKQRMPTYNQHTEIPWEDEVKFLLTTPDHMKNYLWHLHHHHNYSYNRLLEIFPEYLTKKS